MKSLATNRNRFPWLGTFDQDIGRLLERFQPMLFEDDETSSVTNWAPAVDISEESDRYVVRADLPGVDPKDVEVTLENGVLTIRGERKEEKEEKREGFQRAECFRGSFYRRFMMPDSVEADKVSARSDKGVLEVVIPKSPKAQAKRIPVKE